jgi:hypothetical protein
VNAGGGAAATGVLAATAAGLDTVVVPVLRCTIAMCFTCFR